MRKYPPPLFKSQLLDLAKVFFAATLFFFSLILQAQRRIMLVILPQMAIQQEMIQVQ